MNFKRKVQIFISLFVVLLSIIFTGFYIHHENQRSDEHKQAVAKDVKDTYDLITEDIEYFYTYRAYSNLRSEDVEEAMLNRDREKLYNLTLPRYKTLREENPYLMLMQFHAPDGKSILRMHRKEVFGDDIASRRPMLQKVHKSHEIQRGFEGGIEGIAYRIVVPFIENSKYIGALEFGVDPDYIMSKLYKSNKIDTLFMLHETHMAAADVLKYPVSYNGYRFSHLGPNHVPLVEAFVKDNPDFTGRLITVGNKEYDVFQIYVQNNDHNPAGMLLCFHDVSSVYKEEMQVIVGSIFLTFLIIAVLVATLEVVFDRIMKKMNFQEEYVATILNSQKNIIVVTNGKNIIYVNNAFYDFLQYKNLDDFRKDHECICYLFETTETENYLQPEMDGMLWTEYLLAHKEMEHKARITVNGKTSIFTVDAQMMKYDRQLRYVVVFSDITQLNELATLDRLTQVANRFEFDKILEYSLSVSRRYKRPLSILLLDIDHFKHINDRFGHLVGDEVLKALSTLLRMQIRKSDVVARWGGEEFMILLPDTPLPSAIKMAEALRQRIEVNSFATVKYLTCSIGVAEFNPVEEADDLFHRADEKLYAAKNAGRNRIMA
ncbi:MAG: diguanylate cyclase [Sulfuricurvum sp.]|nr:diguanylate cyclase [Sulfuricurvum sp.]